MARILTWSQGGAPEGTAVGGNAEPPLPGPLVAACVAVLTRGARGTGRGARPGGHVRGAWRAPVILVDGRSGSGKSTLAGLLARQARTAGVRGVQVARLDSWYPGWHGLSRGSAITEALLVGGPVPAGETPLRLPGPWIRHAYPAWDWDLDRVSRGVLLDPHRPLVVEGVGALTPVSAGAADLRVWVEVDAGDDPGRAAREGSIRRTRALARDGEAYRPWWQTWAGEEDRHLRRLDPSALADIVVRT